MARRARRATPEGFLHLQKRRGAAGHTEQRSQGGSILNGALSEPPLGWTRTPQPPPAGQYTWESRTTAGPTENNNLPVWTVPVSITGAQGPQGAQGDTGPQGPQGDVPVLLQPGYALFEIYNRASSPAMTPPLATTSSSITSPPRTRGGSIPSWMSRRAGRARRAAGDRFRGRDFVSAGQCWAATSRSTLAIGCSTAYQPRRARPTGAHSSRRVETKSTPRPPMPTPRRSCCRSARRSRSTATPTTTATSTTISTRSHRRISMPACRSIS